ncbi:hypothetical protein F4781DRAFT_380618 [Annulohypoxylon bovei var. microspora]|nr:hypothetical protein F4781DRAFT_380618 [Annulohypoxylon bovei var. microspora]
MSSDSDVSYEGSLNSEIFDELGSFVVSRSATFTCGGSIPIKPASQSSNEAEANTENIPQVKTDELSSLPITIRWDSQRSGATYKITLPIAASDDDGQAQLAALVDDCQPASFGYQGKNIYDESYRKATKLDCSDFSTSFCPYSLGIIDTIAQVLLPNSSGRNPRTGVRAELYKLNFYSAPSGLFKAHVDTPRSEAQFGSLVVSLPCRHEGGQLVVRHIGRSVTYDWSTPKAKAEIDQCQWAAFYSDCEHKVLQLTEGHRLTLTYNLYAVPGVGQLAGNSPALDVYSLPLYQKFKTALDVLTFMPEGGYIGVHCAHAYPHTTQVGRRSLPGILKGADMALYTVFHALGLHVRVKTVLDRNKVDEINEWDSDSYSDYEHEHEASSLSRIGDWGTIEMTEAGGDDGDEMEEIINSFGHSEVQVNWLTRQKEECRNRGFIHLTYGNESGVDYMYTYAAFIIKIPGILERIFAKKG